jgi:hypothetical protein
VCSGFAANPIISSPFFLIHYHSPIVGFACAVSQAPAIRTEDESRSGQVANRAATHLVLHDHHLALLFRNVSPVPAVRTEHWPTYRNGVKRGTFYTVHDNKPFFTYLARMTGMSAVWTENEGAIADIVIDAYFAAIFHDDLAFASRDSGYLIHELSTVFTEKFRAILKGAGIEPLPDFREFPTHGNVQCRN